ncbi:MAG: GNAT family N-acetyltransferase [Brevibacterium sp.]|nr:GNAT family N-acetyltransferase [Brevibacterium sp.]MDN5834766.1 GNAT family N-acetyltransferase [Brevibacterium sp.]MDN5910086.1 GNAT family N-acetyltransferase [Brevibacterium sp.]MDN6134028.1 GNAT family N-acetyltransferase [Brevibacterium sp.]MDN6175496.1 GNAT family N-acetyltransferase [Brevibacterium sp.]
MNERQNQDPSEAGRRTELRSRIRPLGAETADEVFLPFLDLCFNWSMDQPRVEVDELLERDDAAFYFKGWGRNGDIAVAAYAEDSNASDTTDKASADQDLHPDIVGLAWLRLAAIDAVIEKSAADPADDATTEAGSRFTGYGWVAADIPELSLAVLPDHQSQGIGGMLLDVVCTLAKMSGFPAVSLSVADGNGAARLYHDRGFVTVGRNGDSDILVRQLK